MTNQLTNQPIPTLHQTVDDSAHTQAALAGDVHGDVHTTDQSGGINFGSGNRIDSISEIVGRDKIVQQLSLAGFSPEEIEHALQTREERLQRRRALVNELLVKQIEHLRIETLYYLYAAIWGDKPLAGASADISGSQLSALELFQTIVRTNFTDSAGEITDILVFVATLIKQEASAEPHIGALQYWYEKAVAEPGVSEEVIRKLTESVLTTFTRISQTQPSLLVGDSRRHSDRW
jgi:hypothetical protein